MRPTTALILIIFAASCATKPTPYQKEKKHEGFHDHDLDGLRVASFKANEVSKGRRVQSYAEFRAIENCRSEGKLANIIDVFDRTLRKDVVRTSGSGWGPSYGFGMYPYYSRYSSFGFGVGYNTMSSNSWNETLIFPIYEVVYTCAEKIWRPGLVFRELSADEMKVLVKDLKGAIQVERLETYSVNKGVIHPNDIILKANGNRIEHIYEFVRLFTSPDAKVSVELRREGEKLSAVLRGSEVTSDAEKAEAQIIREVCKDKREKNQKLLKERELCL